MSDQTSPDPQETPYDTAPPVLVFADGEDGLSAGSSAARAAGGRVVATLPLDEAPVRIGEQPGLAAVYVDVAQRDAPPALGELLPLLYEGARDGRFRSVVALPLGLIDFAAAQAWHPDVTLLSKADADDRTDAMRQALTPPRHALHDHVAHSPLRRLSTETARIARMLSALSISSSADLPELAEADSAPATRPDRTIAAIRSAIQARRLRDRHFSPSLFADPAWDMLLELTLAGLENRRVTVTGLCEAAAVPSTTALRWIKALIEEGLFTRSDDPEHGRRVFVSLSSTGSTAMRAYLADVQPLRAPPFA